MVLTERQKKQAEVIRRLMELLEQASAPHWHGQVSVEVHIKDGLPIRVVATDSRSVML